jgi:hypothetical protein
VDVLDAAGDALLVQAPDGLQFGPRGGHVDGDERGDIPALGGLAAMQHEIALQGPGGNAGPLAPGAQRHLGAQVAKARREAPGLTRAAAAQGAQQPVQGGGAGRGQGRPHRGRDEQAVVPLQGRQQRGEDRHQQLAGQLITGQPRPLEDGPQLPAGVPTRAARRPPRRAGRGPQPPDGRFAVTARRAAVLVQDSPSLQLVGILIPGTQHVGVFSARSLGHGASFPVRGLVTPVLRHRSCFR